MRLWSRPTVAAGLAILVLFTFVALFAPLVAPHDPHLIDPAHKFIPPVWSSQGTWTYPLGTDQLGRDVLSRVMFGARTSLFISVSAVALAVLIGATVGLISGYAGGWLDTLLMRVADIQLAFPFILLALALLAITESKTAITIILVLAVATWVVHARVVRSRILVERESDYVRAARTLGASHPRIVLKYILRTVAPAVLAIALLELASAMVVESILAFIGLGIDPPAISWGVIMAEGRRNISVAWWMLVAPGVAIFSAVLAVNLVVDGLADVLDPRQRRTHLRHVKRPSRRSRAPQRPSVPQHPKTHGTTPLLKVDSLHVSFQSEGEGSFTVVDDLSFTLAEGERLAIVGESGSGKSMTALTLLGLTPVDAQVSGSVVFDKQNLLTARESVWRGVRGRRIAMISQNPSTALNPVLKVGYQLVEVLLTHGVVDTKKAARERSEELLRDVNILDATRVMQSYPFEISGGMQQRVMIAMALSTEPDLLIADEPTTALDVTTQAQILMELDELVARLGTSVILISHDLGVVAGFAERTIVMYAGRQLESGSTSSILADAQHPYTAGLVAAVESLEKGERKPQGIRGQAIDVRDLGAGCPFANRCEFVTEICTDEMPALVRDGGHAVACHHPISSRSLAQAP